jgi:hypothetical protein
VCPRPHLIGVCGLLNLSTLSLCDTIISTAERPNNYSLLYPLKWLLNETVLITHCDTVTSSSLFNST